MSATIRISPGQMTDSLVLRGASALHGCTDVGGDDSGAFIAAKWPNISDGESLLWEVLAYLNGAPTHPSPDALRAGLDDGNYAAAMAALATVGVTA